MGIIVQKFGGTSVGSIKNIKNIAKQISFFYKKQQKIIVVVSAMSGETNRLLCLAKLMYKKKTINDIYNHRELDVLLSTGEQVTMSLLSIALNLVGVKSKSYTGAQLSIFTDSVYTKARIQHIDTSVINKDINNNIVVVVAGFQGIDKYGNITTLGRGGSDTTAVAISTAINADECQIYTDVSGVYSTDPRLCNNSSLISYITVEDMLELSSLGSKVLQIRSVEFAVKSNMPVRLLSIFDNNPGTLLIQKRSFLEKKMENPLISGVTYNCNIENITVIVSCEVFPYVCYNILICFSDHKIDICIQNIKNLTTQFIITFTISKSDYNLLFHTIQKYICIYFCGHILADNKSVIISIVGVGIYSHKCILHNVVYTLEKHGIIILFLSTSELKLSIFVFDDYMDLALHVLHTTFNLNNIVQ
ncbi:Aspartokinase [Candidatus Portiera aleyrodidarum BT-B-HRs]|uniref:aspartate kinase n=1 Tax=Candidatus Portiera aleyrodidarum TaxID=91844 RepID=UPI00027B30E3|nr:aspartate kinase [Candidatus Portiera aleyrodidarum]AFQ24176.1 aspartokinase [Candidatus Portiera aleyrodidarum BT-B-HRs]AFT80866.1 Aspartokinase [Candidatus Portiera aleyrodidarum BT-B-HRs]ASX27263.1 aspartate kinase [Candidatus Portiera aleyrodidarum MED (Bemisia tabaci)]